MLSVLVEQFAYLLIEIMLRKGRIVLAFTVIMAHHFALVLFQQTDRVVLGMTLKVNDA